MKVTALATLLLAALAPALNSVAAEGPAMPPQAAVCTACHGANGEGMAGLGPRLNGLSSQYIQQQIKLFQQGQRQNPLMAPIAMTLQPDTAAQLGDYFAAVQPVVVTVHKRGEQPVYADPTEALVYQGDWSRELPACVSCHGPSGLGGGPFPGLAGQQAAYIKGQLQAWRNGSRKGDMDGVMATVASKLTDAETDAFANYFANLK